MCRSSAAASAEPGAFVNATVRAPPWRAARVDSTRFGEPPDWLMATHRTSSKWGVAAYPVIVESDTSPHGRPSSTSMRYLAYSAAWSLVPLAAKSTNRGLALRICVATPRMPVTPVSSRWASICGC